MGESWTIASPPDSSAYKTIDWLLKEGGLKPEELDGAGTNPNDGTITLDEAVYFVYHHPDWQKYLPALDLIRFRHPLDPRNVPPQITQRIAELKKAVDASINKEPADDDYCDAFVPEFYQQGLATYADGGLGFGYPIGFNSLEPMELTAAEAFAAELDPKLPHGTCTEATYEVVTAMRAAALQCPVEPIATQNHLFARYRGTALDPSGIGALGWEKYLSDAELGAQYYLECVYQESTLQRSAACFAAARMINPHHPSLEFFEGEMRFPAEPSEGYSRMYRAAQEQPYEIQNFRSIRDLLLQSPEQEKALEMALDLLRSDPLHPYSIFVVEDLCAAHGKCATVAEELLTDYPESGHGEYLQALEAFNQKEKENGRALLEIAVGKNPRHAMAWSQLAWLDYQQGKLEAAEAAARASIAAGPNLATNYELLSTIYLEQGYLEAAYEAAKKESTVFSGNPESLLALGRTALAAGRFTEAEITAVNYCIYFPDDARGYFLWAEIAATKGKIDQALQIVKAAARHLKGMIPTSPDGVALKAEFHRQSAELLLQKPDLKRAMQEAKRAVALDPDEPWNQMTLANVFWTGRNYDEAIRVAEAARDRFPQVAEVWAHLGWLYRGVLRYDDARRANERALELKPHESTALLTDLDITLALESRDRVIAKLEGYRERFAGYAFLHEIDAIYSTLLGDHDRAEREAAKALRYNPKDYYGLLGLALADLARGKITEAQAVANRFQKANPLDGNGPFLAAKVAYARGDTKQAEALARESLKRYPYDDGRIPELSARRLLVAILTDQGRLDEAITEGAQLAPSQSP